MKRWVLLLGVALSLWTPALAQQPDTRPHPGSMRYNKVRIGNLTSCPTGQFVRGFDPRTTVPLCDPVTLPVLDPNIVTTTGVQKVSGKQNVLRVLRQTPAGTPLAHAFECDNADITVLDNIAGDLTFGFPGCSGTNPEPEQEIEYRLSSTAPRALTWHPAFCENNKIFLPTSTSGDGFNFDRVKFRWNAQAACWGVIASTLGVGRGLTTLSSSTTFTCNPAIASRCEMQMTGAAGTVTIDDSAMFTPAPRNGTELWLALQCTNLQTIAWDSGIVDGVYHTRPLSCPANVNTWVEVLLRYSTVENKWIVLVGTTAASGSGHTIRDETTSLPARTNLSFLGAGVACADNSGANSTDCTIPGAGAGATAYIRLPVTGIKMVTTNGAPIDVSALNSFLAFDDTTRECVIWEMPALADYVGSPMFKFWDTTPGDTTTSHNLAFDVEVMTLVAGVTIETDSYSSTNPCDDSNIQGVAHVIDATSCALTNNDALAANLPFKLRVCRAVARDNTIGDARMIRAEFSYAR